MVINMNCKGAIFDMDGLLFDTERVFQQTWQEIAREHDIVLNDTFIRTVSGTSGERLCQVIEDYYHVDNAAELVEDCMKRVREKLAAHVPMKDGVFEVLDFFKQKNVKMAVASSSRIEQIEANLKISGIRDYFAAVVSGTEVSSGKPEPDIFLYAAEKIGCSPKECYVFEDSENGIKAGYAAGCVTVMVPDLIEASEEILPYCSMVCSSLLDFFNELC